MTAPSSDPAGSVPPGKHPVFALLELARRARHAESLAELQFIAVNDTHVLASYRQGALWLAGRGIRALSGVVQIDANAPYAHWLESVCQHLDSQHPAPGQIIPSDLPEALASQWADWLPIHALWLPLATDPMWPEAPRGGLLLARDLPWTEGELGLLLEWLDTWQHAWRSRYAPPPWSWPKLRQKLGLGSDESAERRWWQRPLLRWGALSTLLLLLPVHLSVLAPGELVPAHPAVIRAPLEGVVDSFQVEPNQMVKKGQPLFSFDEALIRSRLEVARQAQATAEAEYRQMQQLALSDTKSKGQLALLTGKIEEKRADTAYLEEQLQRARVLAPQDGIALFDDPTEWIGKPVSIGERIMRIASPGDVEVEAWLPLADAIPLPAEAAISLYLNTTPLSPISARLRYLAHDAVQRPDGTYAYRLRASLTDGTEHRVGLKGTAKAQGGWVPLGYWIIRRPFAGIRTALGW